MNGQPLHDRILELLADEALGQISPIDAQELERLLAQAGSLDTTGFEDSVAAAEVAMHQSDNASEAMPADVAARLKHAADAFCAGQAIARTRPTAAGPTAVRPPQRDVDPRTSDPRNVDPRSIPFTTPARPASTTWIRFAAAALVAIGVAIGLYTISQPAVSTIAEQRLALLSQPSAVRVAWTDWAADGAPPEIPGVTGDVVWSDDEQRGYMRFVGLPANDPTKQQYQLWIIDKERGMAQRISGGIFNGGPGETIVPIEPRLLVNKAAAFAVTIEQPGGTWVSDMTRRVNIAPVPD